jgi:hypothetical protein
MDRRQLTIVFGICALTAMLLWGLAACSVGKSGEAPAAEGDAASLEDVTVDTLTGDHFTRDSVAADTTPASDAPSGADGQEGGPTACAGVICNGKCVASNDCTSCVGAPLLCASQRVCLSGCAQCSDGPDSQFPIECFACDSQHANPTGTCEPADASSYCLSGNYFGAAGMNATYHCSCDGDAGSCPGATQICVPIGATSLCVTCGEPVPNGSEGAACKGGGVCSPSAYACTGSGDP